MKAMTKEQLIEITGLSAVKIEDFIKRGMPMIRKEEKVFYPISVIDWLVEHHLDNDRPPYKNIVLDAYKKGLSSDEIQ